MNRPLLACSLLCLLACESTPPPSPGAEYCAPALENAHTYADASAVGPLSIEVCRDWYDARATTAELDTLQCMAEAEDQAAWHQCRGESAQASKGRKISVGIDARPQSIEMQKKQVDKDIAENAGVLGALRSGDELDGVFGSSNVNGGLGSRGGSADGLGGLGTKGRGSGRSGYGTGGGNFGKKGTGGTGKIGGDPIILGALDKSLIDAVIKRNMNKIGYCYQRELTNSPYLEGKITVKFVIAKDGTVSKASIKSSTMGSDSVEGCITGRFMRFRFPEPKGGGIVIVSYPFIFAPG